MGCIDPLLIRYETHLDMPALAGTFSMRPHHFPSLPMFVGWQFGTNHKNHHD